MLAASTRPSRGLAPSWAEAATVRRRMIPCFRSTLMWDLQPKTGMSMSTCFVPSGRAFALLDLIVQRASVSFRAAFAGSSGRISRAVHPSLIAAFSAALARNRDQRRVQHPAGPGDEASRADYPLKLRGQGLQLARLDRRLAEIPQRVCVWNPVGNAETAEAHPARPPVPHRLPGRFKRQPMAALKHEPPELRQGIQSRAAAFGALGLPRGPLEDRAEPLEIHRPVQRLKRIAIRRNLLRTLLDVPKSRLLRHRGLRCCRSVESQARAKRQVSGGVQLPFLTLCPHPFLTPKGGGFRGARPGGGTRNLTDVKGLIRGSGAGFRLSFGVEGLAGFEHFADDAEKPVDAAAQGSGVLAAALPERAVFRLAGGVPLDGGHCPVVGGVRPPGFFESSFSNALPIAILGRMEIYASMIGLAALFVGLFA